LHCLGLLDRENNLNTIQESQCEYNDDILKRKNTDMTYSEEEFNDLIINAVKTENVSHLHELSQMLPQLQLELDKNGKNALHHACMIKNPEMLAAVLNFKVDVNKLSNDNWSPLHIACIKCNIDCNNTFK
jgi:ankyrin repeat protein